MSRRKKESLNGHHKDHHANEQGQHHEQNGEAFHGSTLGENSNPENHGEEILSDHAGNSHLNDEHVKKRNALIMDIIEPNLDSMDILENKFFGQNYTKKAEARSYFIHYKLCEKPITHLEAFHQKGKGYFYRAYRNGLIDYLDKSKKVSHFFQELKDHQHFDVPASSTFSEEQEEAMIKRCVKLIVRKFNEKHAQIFLMKYDDISNSVIANHMEMSINAVNIALSRIKKEIYYQYNLKF